MCGVCEFCLLGYESSCPNARQTGFNCDGTFQQFAIVSAQSAIPLPPGVDLAEAAPILCAVGSRYSSRLASVSNGCFRNFRAQQFIAVFVMARFDLANLSLLSAPAAASAV